MKEPQPEPEMAETDRRTDGERQTETETETIEPESEPAEMGEREAGADAEQELELTSEPEPEVAQPALWTSDPPSPQSLVAGGFTPSFQAEMKEESMQKPVAAQVVHPHPAAIKGDRELDRIINTIALTSVLVWGGNMLAMQAEHEVWLLHYAGNFAEQARVQALVQSISGALSFVINPILAGWSDSQGRKPLMMLSPIVSLGKNIYTAWRGPSVSTLIVGDMMRPLTMSAWMIGRQAALGDLLKHSPPKYAAASSKIEMMGQVNMIFSPMISAYLVSVGIRLPWIVATGVYLVTLPVCAWLVKETLLPGDRRPFSAADFARRANPGSFLQLFTKGPRLRALAVLEMVGSMCDGRATWQIGNLHRQAVLAWNVNTRGRFMSVSSVFSIGGYMASSSMFKKLGNATSFEIGMVLSALWNAASALCTSSWHFFALIPLNSLSRGLAPIAISTATTLEGTRQGMAQGELQGARSNLQTIVRIFAPLVWGKLFSLSSDRGRPGFFYFVAAALYFFRRMILLTTDPVVLEVCAVLNAEDLISRGRYIVQMGLARASNVLAPLAKSRKAID